MKGIISFLVVLGLAAAAIWYKEPAPRFDGDRWSCPAGYDVYADEAEAIAGTDFVHCVK